MCLFSLADIAALAIGIPRRSLLSPDQPRLRNFARGAARPSRPPPFRKPLRTRARRRLGAACLLFSIVFYSNQIAFPGAAALLPCAGAALIIWSGQSNPTLISRLLGWQPLVYIGKTLLPLYLVHWPVIVFGKLLQPNLPHLAFAFAAAAASFALASISFRYIETPLRYGALTRRHSLRTAVAAMHGYSG